VNSRLDKLEDKPELSIEGLDVRMKTLQRGLEDHVESAITLKKVRVVVEDAIEAQQEQIKRLRNKTNDLDERADRANAWRQDFEDLVKEL
jgi:hypothetical protein